MSWRALDSPAAELIVRLHSSGRGAELVRAKHLRLWDDLVALRFLDASLGTLSPVAGQPGWSELTAVDPAAVRRAIVATLRMFPPRAHCDHGRFPDCPAATAAGRAGVGDANHRPSWFGGMEGGGADQRVAPAPGHLLDCGGKDGVARAGAVQRGAG